MSDLYGVLGIDRSADQATIRHAYRDLARATHPDAGGDEREMMRINEAWRVLGDPAQRASYDAQMCQPAPGPVARRDGRTVLDFGRYEGWSLAEVAVADDDYLEWLRRTPFGRSLRTEIGQVLEERARAIEALRPDAPVTRRRGRSR